MLEIKNLSFAYDDKQVLDNVSLTLKKHEIVAIVGGSGVGKTTLFHLIAGILPLQSGSITVLNQQNFQDHISYMLQKDLLFEHKTVMDNIILPLIIRKIDKKLAKAEALEQLQALGLADIKDVYPRQLSGGMRQRVAFLRTYMFKRSIILLDEAFSALDAYTRINMHKWYLETHHKLGLSTLLITHDIDEALALSDRIYVLGNKPGKILLELTLNKQKMTMIDVYTNQEMMEHKKRILKAMGF